MKESCGPVSTQLGLYLRVPFVLILVALGAPLPAVSAAAQGFAVVKTINVDFIPFGIAAFPDGQTVWVANSGGTPFFGGPPNSNKITIIDIPTLEEEPDKITVGNFPEHIAFTRDGSHAVVTNSSDATVSVIDTASRTVTQTVSLAPVGLAFPFGIIFSRNEKKIFVTTGAGLDNAIAVLDSRNIDDVQLAGTLPVNGYPGIPELSPENHQLLVPSSPAVIGTASLFVINPNSNKILREFSIPINNAFANDIAVTPDGRFAYISIFAFSGGTGGVWVVDLKHLKTVTTIDTGDPSVYGMSITPDGRFVFATNFTNGEVAVIDPKRNEVITTVPVGHEPNQVAVTLDGSLAFVTNQGDTTVSVISIPRDDDD
jgi:YVTN family beta-propeller protein